MHVCHDPPGAGHVNYYILYELSCETDSSMFKLEVEGTREILVIVMKN